MKINQIFTSVFKLLVILLTLFMLSGCKSQPETREVEVIREVFREVPVPVTVVVPGDTVMPLTPSILQRLSDSNPGILDSIDLYQLRLYGRIILEREYSQSNDSLEKGTATFENLYIRETVTFNDTTEGVAMHIDLVPGETVLYVCFEEDQQNQLTFGASVNDPHSYFFLKFNPSMGPIGGEEKGTLEYAGETYKVKFTDTTPYLLIRLSQKDIDKIESRVVPGRRIQ